MDIEGFDIRFSESPDLTHLQQWFRSPASSDPFPFGPDEQEMALQNWIGFSKYKASLTGMIQDRPCAIGTLFLMPYKKVAHHCSFYLIVDPEHRNRGIGTAMVRNLLNLAKARFRLEGIYLEIYEPNPLISIASKLGFSICARQENFVHLGNRKVARVLLEHFFS